MLSLLVWVGKERRADLLLSTRLVPVFLFPATQEATTTPTPLELSPTSLPLHSVDLLWIRKPRSQKKGSLTRIGRVSLLRSISRCPSVSRVRSFASLTFEHSTLRSDHFLSCFQETCATSTLRNTSTKSAEPSLFSRTGSEHLDQ